MGVNARSLYRETRRRGISSVEGDVVGRQGRGARDTGVTVSVSVDCEPQRVARTRGHRNPPPEFQLRFDPFRVCPRTNVQTCVPVVIRIIA